MANQPFRQAYDAAATELESLLIEQERIEERILALRKTMNALATTISQHEGKDKNFLDYAEAKMREIVDTSLTRDIEKIITTSSESFTATEIRDQLMQLGGSLLDHKSPMASIHAILNRLTESGRAKETLKNGKKAWERYKTLSERIKEVQSGRFNKKFPNRF